MIKKINADICIGCGSCQGVCPVECISFTDDGKCEIDASSCIGCGSCQAQCPVDAIEDAE